MLRFLQICLVLFCALLVSPAAPAQERVVPETKAEAMLSFAPLVKKAAPAVVNIYTSKKVRMRRSPLLNDPFFSQLFGDKSPFNTGLAKEKVVNSLGSGVIVSSNGLVITNNHVIEGSDEIRVLLSDRREFAATLVLNDNRSDLAVLKIDAANEVFPYLELGDSDHLEVGDMVLAVGNPFGVGQTVTSGIVSALARNTVGISDYQFFIQTDAAINPGNSGGALVDMHGRLIGINTAIYTRSGGSNGIGFATPSNMARTVLSSVMKGQRIVRPWLGAAGQAVTQKIASALGIKNPRGVIVKNVYPGSAAAKAGIKVNDIILEVGEKQVNDEQALRYRVATFEVGTTVPFKILRGGKEYLAQVAMEPPVENPPRQLSLITAEHILSGIQVANLSPALADEMGTSEYAGVVIYDIRSTPPARLGLKKGDIIVRLNGVNIATVDQLVEVLEDSANENTTEFSVKRGGTVLSFKVAL